MQYIHGLFDWQLFQDKDKVEFLKDPAYGVGAGRDQYLSGKSVNFEAMKKTFWKSFAKSDRQNKHL